MSIVSSKVSNKVLSRVSNKKSYREAQSPTLSILIDEFLLIVNTDSIYLE